MPSFTIKPRVAVLVAVALGVIASFAPGGAGAAATCTPHGSTTVASNSYARVYAKPNDQVFVCVKATGRTTRLKGASATLDVFALGGMFVGWSSGSEQTIVNVIHIPDGAIPVQLPYNTGDHIDKIVVKSDGAAAWAATPSGDNTYVQGFDRRGHSADQFSDDTKNVVGSSLKSLAGHTIRWKYDDGSSDTAQLY